MTRANRNAGPVAAEVLARLLTRLEGATAEGLQIAPLAGDRGSGDLKNVGYGEPLLVRYRAGGQPKAVVFRTQSANWYGHDRRADRAYLCLLAADTFADQPRHVAARDVGAIRADELVSLHDAGEFYLVTEYVDGALYADDLREIERTGRARPLDLARVDALADHLVEVHSREPDADLEPVRARAVRDLLGSGEGIFGIVDGYPRAFEDAHLLRRIEELALAWRWRVGKRGAPRLSRTHGDFHPYNILFRTGTDFTALDASRGGLGMAADDLAALGINYLFGGLRCPQAWEHGFGPLWFRLFERYESARGDAAARESIGPFLAWRALVLASPVWYPGIAAVTRRALLVAATRWLDSDALDPRSMADIAFASAEPASTPNERQATGR